jgi:malonate decarboxylase alpha subunit
MIYGDDVSHVVTEEGISYLYKTEGIEERRRAIAAIAGVSPIGIKAKPEETVALREKGIVAFPEDLVVHRLEADRSLLAARSMEDLVAWSGGLYHHRRSSGVGNVSRDTQRIRCIPFWLQQPAHLAFVAN